MVQNRSQPEREIEETILQYLTLKGWFVFKHKSTGTYSKQLGRWLPQKGKYTPDGISDILGMLPNGNFLAIEVKRFETKSRLSPAQKAFLQRVNNGGGKGFMAYSIECVKKHLKDYL